MKVIGVGAAKKTLGAIAPIVPGHSKLLNSISVSEPTVSVILLIIISLSWSLRLLLWSVMSANKQPNMWATVCKNMCVPCWVVSVSEKVRKDLPRFVTWDLASRRFLVQTFYATPLWSVQIHSTKSSKFLRGWEVTVIYHNVDPQTCANENDQWKHSIYMAVRGISILWISVFFRFHFSLNCSVMRQLSQVAKERSHVFFLFIFSILNTGRGQKRPLWSSLWVWLGILCYGLICVRSLVTCL